MKHLPVIVILSIISSIVLGQPTIDNAEDFTIGTVVKFKQCNPTAVEAGATGASQTWDFSSLTPEQDTTTIWMVLPSSTTNGNLFPTATLVEKKSDGRLTYFDKTPSENKLVGFEDTLANIIIHYPNSLVAAVRPLTFGTIVTDTFTDNYTAGGYDFSGQGIVTIHADGYGTLILPNGTHDNVLRVKITQIQQDTLIQFGNISTTTTILYTWYDGVHAAPILKIDSTHTSTFTTKSVEYLISEGSGITEVHTEQKFKYYPNPANNQIVFVASERGLLFITNRLGQTINKVPIKDSKTIISTDKLQIGIYLLTFKTDKGNITSKLIID